MKKSKVFGKKQITLALMVVALAGAVWLNMKYSTSGGLAAQNSSKPTASYLGQAQYVNGSAEESKLTGGKVDDDYFEKTRKERNETREEALRKLKETTGDAKLGDNVKAAAVEKAANITARMDTEASIEALLKAKGFSSVLAVIGDDDINILVKTSKLSDKETVQIQDIATSQSGLPLDKVKIITVK